MTSGLRKDSNVEKKNSDSNFNNVPNG